MTTQSSRGKQKRYGLKMSNPRIRASKEHRNCGPLGIYTQWKKWIEDPIKFRKPNVMPYNKFRPKILKPVTEIRKKRRLQISQEDLITYFGL